MGTQGGTDVGTLVPKWPSCLFSIGCAAFKPVLIPRSSGNLDVEAPASQATFKGASWYVFGELAARAGNSKAALRKQFLLWMNWMCYSGTSNLRDVLLRLVEFLCEVLGRRLAGYLDKGHLFSVACQVARRLAHAVVVVPLDEEVWAVEQTEGQRRRRRGRRRKITEALLQCVMRGLACRLKPNSYGISMILCHPHGSGAAKQAYGKAPNICNIREVAPHPMRDLHTPCTAPGCSMGRLLQRKARKKKEFKVPVKTL